MERPIIKLLLLTSIYGKLSSDDLDWMQFFVIKNVYVPKYNLMCSSYNLGPTIFYFRKFNKLYHVRIHSLLRSLKPQLYSWLKLRRYLTRP